MADDIARIATWLQPRHILLDVEADGGHQLLEIAAATIAAPGHLDPVPIVLALSRREQAGSTGLGDGLAIPHARIRGISEPTTLFMRTSHGVAFHAPDGKPVSQLLFILAPVGGSKDEHLQLLALVAQLFSLPGFRTQLAGAKNPTAAADVFQVGVAKVTSITPAARPLP